MTIPNQGGAKIWECTQDLGVVLTRLSEDGKSIAQGFKNKTVLDLGCGAGILGIVALNAGADVHFQDYVSKPSNSFRKLARESLCSQLQHLQLRFLLSFRTTPF